MVVPCGVVLPESSARRASERGALMLIVVRMPVAEPAIMASSGAGVREWAGKAGLARRDRRARPSRETFMLSSPKPRDLRQTKDCTGD